MADMITSSSKCTESDAVTMCHWEFSYDVESAGKHNSFCVVVKADEMVDATDGDEAKTLANVKASAIKTSWIAALADADITTPEITVPESVTL